METKESDQFNYTVEHLQRYHRGEMSAAEMHQLEKAALSDPFLSDALDGFYQVDDYDRSVLITGIKKQRKPIYTLQQLYVYTGIAASIMVILFATWILSKDEQPVDNSLVKRNFNREKIKTVRTDSGQIKLAENRKFDLDKEKETALAQNNPQEKENKKIASIEMPEQANSEIDMIKKNDQVRFEEPMLVKENKVPVQQDNIQLAAQNESKDEQSMMLTSTSSQKNKSSALAVDHGYIPQNGWDAFHRYMTNGLKAVPLTESDIEQKKYLVRFVLDRENKPSNIEFPKSPYPSEGLKNAIITLLLKGPVWSGRFDETKYIEVRIDLP